MKKLLTQNLKNTTALLFLFVLICYSVEAQTIFKKILKFPIPKACVSNPIITCPPNFYACPKASTLPFNTGFASAIPGGPNCSAPVITYKDQVITTGPCNGATEIQRTWIATDPQNSNLKSSCTQTIKLSDESSPVITNCPLNINARAGQDCKANVSWTPPTVTDNCGKLFLTVSHISGDAFSIGATTVVYTAEDLCGNMTQCSFTITVEGTCCKSNPILICPKDFVGCPSDSTLPHHTGKPSIAPGAPACSTPSVNYKDSVLSTGPCNGSIKILRTWKAFDPYDGTLYTTCIQNIELKDSEAPSIMNLPANITVAPGKDCKATVHWIEPQTADFCGVKTLKATHAPGSTFSEGTTIVTYTATDKCGNTNSKTFTVTVSACCSTPPIIQCPLNYTNCPKTNIDPSITGQATATKSSIGCGDPILTFSDSVISFNCPGAKLIYRKWKATDSNNPQLYSTCTQLIELKDLTPPTFNSCPANVTVNTNTPDCKATVHWVQPTASDNCNGNVIISSNYTSGSSFSEGVTTVIIIGTDECGNIAQHIFTITVINTCCKDRPKITCPADFNGCPTEHCGTNISGTANASPGNQGCPQPILSFKDSLIHIYSYCLHAKKFVRIWKATDPNDPNNYSTCRQIIDLLDRMPPTWNSCPPNITVDAHGACEKSVYWTPPVATDNCSGVTISSNYSPGNIFPNGTTTVIYTAKDACGNVTSHQFNITVIGSGLSIECPNDIVVEKKDHYGTIVTWQAPKVKTCGNCKDTIKGFVNMGSYNGSKYFCSLTTATWIEAKAICESLGGKLVVINSKDENDYLTSKLMGTTAFIGLHDSNTEGNFEWIDNSPLTFTNWYPGQPNNANGDQDYCEILPDGTWNDQYGKNCYREFICEIPCYTIKQIEGLPSGSVFKCGTTRVTYVAQQGNAKDTCSFTVTVKCNGSNYCESRAQSCGLLWIKNISLSNLNNTSGPSQNGYSYYPYPCAELKWGKQYDLCLTPGFANQIYNVYWKVWIDYNGDGDFMDQDEFVAYGVSNTTICGKITLPWNCMCPVVNTRMRVSMSYGSYPGNSCCIFAYGEVEDYCINISHGNFGPNNQNELTQQIDPVEIFTKENTKPLIEVRTTGTIVEEDLQLVPNPAQSIITLLTTSNEASKLRVYDAKGRQIYFNSLQEINYRLDVSNWNDGIYLIVLESRSGKKILKKLNVIH
ncbi:MAG: HYR domain-containing protein [Saprospiraceae bacterium]|nr:HYR domain-containing protein [Saprospiraceae bacterium]